jgi:hypothetical protein
MLVLMCLLGCACVLVCLCAFVLLGRHAHCVSDLIDEKCGGHCLRPRCRAEAGLRP